MKYVIGHYSKFCNLTQVQIWGYWCKQGLQRTLLSWQRVALKNRRDAAQWQQDQQHFFLHRLEIWCSKWTEAEACGNTASLPRQKLPCVFRRMIHYFDTKTTEIFRLWVHQIEKNLTNEQTWMQRTMQLPSCKPAKYLSQVIMPTLSEGLAEVMSPQYLSNATAEVNECFPI